MQQHMKFWLSGNSTALQICLLQNSIFCLFPWQMLPCAREYWFLCLIRWVYIMDMEIYRKNVSLRSSRTEREKLHGITFYDASNVISVIWFTYKQCKSNLADYILRQKTIYFEMMPEPIEKYWHILCFVKTKRNYWDCAFWCLK